jgi:hypothetical protein
MNDEGLAEQLNREGFFPCRGSRFTAQIVLKMRCRHQIWIRLGNLHKNPRSRGYTVPEMARLIDIDPSWIYRSISDGKIEITKDQQYGCYLFPRTRAAVRSMKQLRKNQVVQVSFRKEHCDG